jgi:hypothetical protein
LLKKYHPEINAGCIEQGLYQTDEFVGFVFRFRKGIFGSVLTALFYPLRNYCWINRIMVESNKKIIK